MAGDLVTYLDQLAENDKEGKVFKLSRGVGREFVALPSLFVVYLRFNIHSCANYLSSRHLVAVPNGIFSVGLKFCSLFHMLMNGWWIGGCA